MHFAQNNMQDNTPRRIRIVRRFITIALNENLIVNNMFLICKFYFYLYLKLFELAKRLIIWEKQDKRNRDSINIMWYITI